MSKITPEEQAEYDAYWENFDEELLIKTVSKIVELRKSKLTISEIAKIVGIGINKTTKILKENKVSTKKVK